MEVMYTDVNRLPQGSLEKYSVDLELGGNNDFELQMNVKNHCMSAGCIWYVKDEEYGGIVDNVKVDTEKSKVYYSGRSWRGVLEKKVIRPDTGKDVILLQRTEILVKNRSLLHKAILQFKQENRN